MLKFKHIGVLYQAADSWDEVQLRHLQLIGKELPARELLALWCNVPIGTFSHAKDIDTILSTALAFLIAPCPEWPLQLDGYPTDVMDLTVRQVNDLNSTLSKDSNVQTVIDALTVVLDRDVSDIHYRIALPLVKEYAKQVSDINKKWTKEMPHKPTAAETQANPDKLNSSGMWGTVFRMAGEDLTKMEAIWQQPFGRFYLAVYTKYEQAQYQQRLHNILNPKDKPSRR